MLWIAGIIVSLAALLAGVYYFLREDTSRPEGKSLIKPLLKDQFTKMVTEASDSLYQVRFNHFDFDLKKGTALITAFELIPDKKRFALLKTKNAAPNYLLYCKADTLRLIGLGFKKRDSVTRFDIDKVIINNPLLTVRTRYRGEQVKDTSVKEKLFYKLAGKLFKRMYVARLAMPGTRVVWINNNRSIERRTVIKANIDISEFSTQPSEHGAIITIARYMHSPDSLYNIIFNNIQFVPSTGNATIRHISAIPVVSKAKYSRIAKFDKDRYHFEYDGVVMKGIESRRFLQRQELHMTNFTVNKLWAEVYKDYHWPKKQVMSRRNTYPNEKLRRLAIDVKVDTMRIHKGAFYHTIFPKRSEKVATFAMNDIESTCMNINNIEREVRKNPLSTVHATCKLMGAAKMRSTFVFNLRNGNAPFIFKSTLASIDGKALNPVVRPLAMMEIKNGTINKMTISLKADEYMGKGKVDLYYSDLKINLLKRDKENDALKNMGLVSFITNVAVPNNNPGKDGKLRPGPINRMRGPKETFFGFIWYCMLDGASSAIMGYDQKKKKPNKNILIKMGEAIAGPKDKDR
jgi:hypothetical protein